MSYNPRIKNISGGTVDISGSLAATNVSTYVSASNANIATVVANSISASTVDSGTSLDITLKSVKSSIRKVTSSISVQTSDTVILVDATNDNIDLTLPSASFAAGQRFIVKKVDSTDKIIRISGQKTDSLVETKILSGSLATQTNDQFGFSVAFNSFGNILVVGANGDERTIGSVDTGLAYVFTNGSSGWTESAILSGSLAVESADGFD